ncbi:MAG: hypothetical protein R8K46_08000 [Mariprofundaceae bacterium]
MAVLNHFGLAVALCLLLAPLSARAAPGLAPEILRLEQQWAAIKYELPQPEREEAFKQLLAQAEALAAAWADKAEPLVMQALILHNYAGERRGLAALRMVKQCRDILTRAEGIDPAAMGGLGLVSLGMLYYKVPGRPIAFGDDARAEEYLAKALALNPSSLEANYYMGDYLIDQERYAEAVPYLQKAVSAPTRPEWRVADAGRKGDAEKLLAQAEEKTQDSPQQ